LKLFHATPIPGAGPTTKWNPGKHWLHMIETALILAVQDKQLAFHPLQAKHIF